MLNQKLKESYILLLRKILVKYLFEFIRATQSVIVLFSSKRSAFIGVCSYLLPRLLIDLKSHLFENIKQLDKYLKHQNDTSAISTFLSQTLSSFCKL
ncbi:hypothetical protein BpHYR1_036700 [Brachionus plicatilis]|uniref:Uncharacterized protein n=1 Tax=Brachionus plicatilis TaxID=10195 RepID=A0A3M7QTH3_BRAPC|nr:hypothetical protein BpHYR1_036700 [Brachionus plicatilis]